MYLINMFSYQTDINSSAPTKNINNHISHRQYKKAQEPYPKPILPTEAFALPVKRKNK